MTEAIRAAIGQLGTDGYKPGSSAKPGWTYSPIPFPGFEDVPCHRPNSPERWELIRRHCEFADAWVLDLGCATGYFAFKAMQEGAEYIQGFEMDPKALGVCHSIQTAFDIRNMGFWGEHLLDGPVCITFDVGFAMSVLNWVGKEQAEDWLEWAYEHVFVLFVEMPLRGDALGGADWLECDADTVDWLREHTRYRHIEAIGKTQGPHQGKWRTLFRCATEPLEQDRQIARGREAEVLLTTEGHIQWVANGPEAHPESAIGWRLCMDRLKPPHFPHVMAIAKHTDGLPSVLMERVEGAPPSEWDQGQADAILAELARANIEHRDLRLANIIRRQTGEWCLVDFGWACDRDDRYPVAMGLGNEACPRGGRPSDRYAMGVVKGKLSSHRGW
jgi:SAM-dependent methyltransferase